MKKQNPTDYIQEMIGDFTLPGSDQLQECLLALPGKEPVWDSAILISTEQSKPFYSDLFQFWVRALFFFLEDIKVGAMFRNAIPLISCQPVSSADFRAKYFELLTSRTKDSYFVECQAYPTTYIELENRSFENAYSIIDSPTLQSMAAHSDGEYVAIFSTAHVDRHLRIMARNEDR